MGYNILEGKVVSNSVLQTERSGKMEDVLKLAGAIALGVFGGLIAKEAVDVGRVKLAEKLAEAQQKQTEA